MDKKITAQTLKGFRDFLPKEAISRQYLINKIKSIFERFGFDPLETPALEYAETLLGKYGDEADKLLYLFEDRGKRKVGLRYDQTVPLARVIAQYQNLPKPFKRYQIQPVWRADNTQKGRFREFMQCDIDTVGVGGIYADAEIISCVLNIMENLGFKKYSMRINDRRIFQLYNLSSKAAIALDKTDKGPIAFIKQLMSEGKTNQEADELFNKIVNNPQPKEIKELFLLLKNINYKEGRNYDFWFDPTLIRGLDYYTSFIFELRIEDYGVLSVGGGGRYDKLIGQFTSQDAPAVGFAFGFDRLLEAMKLLNLLPNEITSTKILVTVFSDDLLKKSISIANELRNNNINTDINLDTDLRLDKQLKYANKKGIPYVIIIGPEEVKNNVVKLKDMKTGEQITLTTKELINKLCK